MRTREVCDYTHKTQAPTQPDLLNYDSRTDRKFYVSVRDAGRTGILLGPYSSHSEALENVERGKTLARDANPWAAFYSFGTCSTDASHEDLEAVFGR